MPVVRMTTRAAFLWTLVLVGCRAEASLCPQATVTANPQEIPEGLSVTDLLVEVTNPSPDNELEVVTRLSSISGVIADQFALATTFTCAHDVSGPVEICVNAAYTDPDGVLNGSEAPGVAAAYEYIRQPHVRLYSPLDCSETQCLVVTCPDAKNVCPVVSSLTAEPTDVPEGGTATIEVVAEDPDNNPEALQTTITVRYGTVADPNASTTTYTCDPDVGGAIEICVVASDGDSTCDDELCTFVRCPGEPLENACPIIADFSADPNPVETGDETTTVVVEAIDPDGFPEPLETELTSDSGVFGDPNASETTFRCGQPGPVEIFVEATDGDPECNKTRSLVVQCPADVQPNICPMLFVINGIPRIIPTGETSTPVETRGQDTDGLPDPLTLTLHALWGTFENTGNIQEPNNVVAQNATYVCSQPGEIEICVDATDGKCTKTLCDTLVCPADISAPAVGDSAPP
jgi:hypothetical protein